MKASEAQRQIEALRREEADIHRAMSKDPEALEIDAEIAALQARRKRILSEKHDARLAAITAELARLRSVKKAAEAPPEAPPELAAKVTALTKGTTSKLHAIAWNEDQSRAIVKEPGSTWYDGSGRNYAQTKYYLVDMLAADKDRRVLAWTREPVMLRQHEGRMPPKVRRIWENILHAKEKA